MAREAQVSSQAPAQPTLAPVWLRGPHRGVLRLPGPKPPGARDIRRAGPGWLTAIREIIMCGTTGTARQATAGGHARHAAASGRAAPAGGTARQPSGAARIPPLADPQGTDVTGRWPLRSYLELGVLPSAVPCARLHTRQLLWEWGLATLSPDAELLVSEIITNAIQITQAGARTAPVRLWLLADRARLLILVWDASPLPPVRVSPDGEAENGRGLLLVEALSARWDHYGHPSGGKVVWALCDPADTPA
jgi:anti-sigma regulatory factor (Ser/Thr protein kinase)